MSTATDVRPSVKVTDAGPSLKKISFEIPAETVTARLREALDTVAGSAALPGFRAGKVPRSLIEKRFGAGAREETKNRLIAESYKNAIEEHKLKVVGDPTNPEIEKLELVDGKPLAFDVEVEVMPDFELPKFEGISVRKPTLQITDEMVSKEVEKACVNDGTLESHTTPEPGDYLTGHAVMRAEDKTEFYNLNGAVVQIPAPDKGGKGMILGIMVDDFTRQFGLPKPGDTATIKTVGPESHENEKIRGVKVTITFKVERIDRIIPAAPDAVAKAHGFDSAEQFTDRVRTRMQQRVLVQQQAAMRQQVARWVMQNTSVELPKRLTATQSARNLERQRLELMYRGADPAQIEERMAELRAQSNENTVNELKLFFVLARIADELKVKVNDNDINARIAQMAFESGIRPDKLRQDLIAQQRIPMIFQQVREHKALDALLAKATITEVTAEEYDKEMAAQGLKKA